MKRKLLLFLLILPALNLQCTGRPSSNLGLRPDGTLSPCPSSPNCVSSMAGNNHFIKPFSYHGSMAAARHRLLDILRKQARVQVVTVTSKYIHAEFTSTLFRFVDDVEFVFDEKNKIIHLRSASRVGIYDFGANRSRIENLRTFFETEEKV